jgi:hypothetical protein
MVFNGVIGISVYAPSISIAMFFSGIAGLVNFIFIFLPEDVNAMLCSMDKYTNVNVGESAIRTLSSCVVKHGHGQLHCIVVSLVYLEQS